MGLPGAITLGWGVCVTSMPAGCLGTFLSLIMRSVEPILFRNFDGFANLSHNSLSSTKYCPGMSATSEKKTIESRLCQKKNSNLRPSPIPENSMPRLS